ncbi:MAG: hypothetical protein ACREEV_00630, partial [Dongiaceae bacterium]
VRYGDLCTDPAGTLRRLHRHCQLDGMDERIGEQASRIAAPSYYRADLSERDREAVWNETEAVASRLSRFADGVR